MHLNKMGKPSKSGQKKQITIQSSDEEDIWRFIYRCLIKKETHKKVGKRLWKDYIDKTDSKWTPEELDDYYNGGMEQDLYKADLDARTMLELYKFLEIELTEHAEHLLEKQFGAIVRVDRRTRQLVSYRLIEEPQPKKKKVVLEETRVEEDSQMIDEEEEEGMEEVEEPQINRRSLRPRAGQEEPKTIPARITRSRVLEHATPPAPVNYSPPKRPSTTKPRSPVKSPEAVRSRVVDPRKTVTSVPQRIVELDDVPSKRRALTSVVPERSATAPVASLPSDICFSKSLEKKMWDYIRLKVRTELATSFVLLPFWVEFCEQNLDLPISSPNMFLMQFQKMLPDMYKQEMDVNHKLFMYEKLNVFMSPDAVKWILDKDNIIVDINDDNRVVSWTAGPRRATGIQRWSPKRKITPVPDIIVQNTTDSDSEAASTAPNLSDNEEKKPETRPFYIKRVNWSKQEELGIWEWLYHVVYDEKRLKVRKTDIAPKGLKLWDKYIEETKSDRTPSNLAAHYRKLMIPSLYKSNVEFSKMMILFKALSIDIDKEAKNYIEDKFGVVLELKKGQLLKFPKIKGDRTPKSPKKEVEEIEQNVHDEEMEEEEETNGIPRELHSQVSIDVAREDMEARRGIAEEREGRRNERHEKETLPSTDPEESGATPEMKLTNSKKRTLGGTDSIKKSLSENTTPVRPREVREEREESAIVEDDDSREEMSTDMIVNLPDSTVFETEAMIDTQEVAIIEDNASVQNDDNMEEQIDDEGNDGMVETITEEQEQEIEESMRNEEASFVTEQQDLMLEHWNPPIEYQESPMEDQNLPMEHQDLPVEHKNPKMEHQMPPIKIQEEEEEVEMTEEEAVRFEGIIMENTVRSRQMVSSLVELFKTNNYTSVSLNAIANEAVRSFDNNEYDEQSPNEHILRNGLME